MTQRDVPTEEQIAPDFLIQLASLGSAAAESLVQRELWTPQFAQQLAEAALQRADVDRETATAWVTLAIDILGDSDTSPGDGASDERALVHYAQARLKVQDGELAQAEIALLRAQELWQHSGNSAWLARSNLGLSQVLTMQGRYADAEVAIRSAITWLEQADRSQLPTLRALATAQRNLANVLMYQERHSAALVEYYAAEGYLSAIARTAEQGAADGSIDEELAHIALNRANALTFLDRPIEAEAALLRAIELFEAGGDILNRGRARTNLGRLYLREGRFAAALEQFDRSALDLIGEMPADAFSEVERLRQADELLLEHAAAYLALNLFQEASSALQRCEALFRSAQQPFELARTRYTQGLLRHYNREYAASRAALEEALRLFDDLHNRFWANRTATALAALDFQEGRSEQATVHLETLLQDARLGDPAQDAISWDISSLAEARLLYTRVLLETGGVPAARQVAEQLADELGLVDVRIEEMPPIPHLYLRLEHLRGRIEQMDGNQDEARKRFEAALDVMERQRAALSLEEIRTAFLDDKTSIYGDLILTSLDKDDVSSEDAADAFNISERARSRSLLERIMVTVEEDRSSAASPDVVVHRDALRQEMHWLYNQMLDEPVRQQDKEFLHLLRVKESALEQLEWRSSPLRTQAEPVKLQDFQRTLGSSQQALVYTIVRDEVMAFRVDAESIQVYRRLCSADELAAAQAELRFQLGRAELGEAYLRRHGTRLRRMLHKALERLYRLLVAPVRADLAATRIRVIPYGSMHLLPFHALWDGAGYLVQQYEFSYAPSASLAVRSQGATGGISADASFAGVALSDESIPEARLEVKRAAKHFPDAALFLDNDASRAGLEHACARADILHIATHGLFRPDNSFFSALKLADGWIDVREIYRLPLAAQLVVLSACESGAGEIRGADEVVGLARGFIGAGAQSLVVSLWNVHDASTAKFMDRFYGGLVSGSTGGQLAAALRAAQIAAITEEQHPYYWAPFTAVG